MSTLSRVKTWASGDTLTAVDLNAEFNNLLNDYNGSITNANISGSAAIAYSKLALTGSIVGADLSASAAIAYSKLNLTGGIVNADISGSAAIAVSKINTGISGSIVGTSDTQTVTNKRITKRAPAITQSATPTINTDVTDVAHITGLAQAITSMTSSLTGTPVEGDTLRIDITDNGTARAITWGASFEASGGVPLPTTTVISTRLDVGFVWNSVTSKWRVVAVA